MGNTKFKSIMVKSGLLAVMVVMTMIGLIIADVATRPHRFVGQIKLICDPKGKENLAAPADTLTVPSATIPFDVFGLASGRQLKSIFAWAGQSAKQRSLGWKLSSIGNVNANPLAGQLTLTLPFDVTFQGKTYKVPVTLTTESTSDPYGAVTGRRANPGEPTFNVKLVGGGVFHPNAKDFGLESQQATVPVSFRIIVDGRIEADGGSVFFRDSDKKQIPPHKQ